MLRIRSPEIPIDKVYPVTIDMDTIDSVSTPVFMHPGTIVAGHVETLHLIGNFGHDASKKILDLVIKKNIHIFTIQDMDACSHFMYYLIEKHAYSLMVIRGNPLITENMLRFSRKSIGMLYLIDTVIDFDDVGTMYSLRSLMMEAGTMTRFCGSIFNRQTHINVFLTGMTITRGCIDRFTGCEGISAFSYSRCKIVDDDQIAISTML